MKKILLLAIVLLVPMLACADSDATIDGIRYHLSSANGLNQAKVIQNEYYDEETDYYYSDYYYGDIVIPKSVTYDGKEYAVTAIGSSAFSWSYVSSVTIPNSVISINDNAFQYCSSITTLNIPESVTSIGKNVFYGCESLSTLTIDSKNPVYDSRNECNAIIETATNTLIEGCNTSVIPNTVTAIASSAFYGRSGLQSITIPNSITRIEASTFNGCSGLTSISIPNSVTFIGSSAFEGCKAITSITIPKSVQSIETNVLRSCDALTTIIVESGNTYYDSRDNCNAVIEKSTESLIIGCKNSTIPNGVKIIGESAFCWCNGLTSITIPSSVTSIEGWGFCLCRNLSYVSLPDGLTSIGRSAFINCTKLTSITIPSNVTTIGNAAFSGCTGLTSITIPAKVTSIDKGAFDGCTGLTSIKVADGNPVYDSRNNCNAVIETATNTLLWGCKNTSIPNTVTAIGDNAFENCKNLTSITIPSSVKTIGKCAFEYCI